MPPWLKKVLSSAEMKAWTTSRRIFVIGKLDTPLAGEGLNGVAVIAAHVGRQRRLVGEQFLRARQAGGEPDPDGGEEQEAAERRSRPRGAPSCARTTGSTRSWTRWLKATKSGSGKLGKLRKRRRFQGRGIHCGQALAAWADYEKRHRAIRSESSVSIALASASTIGLRPSGVIRIASSSALLM